ncbi:A-kinase-interacting protein 1 [Myripristis murdjan]|uniref:A kinase (PRKA) interacting protein 1 n=1 Tax=Myripristis murdjan TaxID=586833 RepID=A0A667Z484_9TELE|nr:A-kinase-interacting protein 1 [Myripristis murdjan]XP_029910577.1 A-kinase-interacting protein 1 [Myripristis murdjan]
MASQAWLESSLRRSASLGLEVLERASRRSVDWTSTSTSHSPTTTDEDAQRPIKRSHTKLDDAFETIADFMALTSYQCKKFYEADHCTERSNIERTHVCRFHTQTASGTSAPAAPTRRNGLESADEDFYIEVSPGTYAITASLSDSQQQTQMVSIHAGESINLTFNL